MMTRSRFHCTFTVACFIAVSSIARAEPVSKSNNAAAEVTSEPSADEASAQSAKDWRTARTLRRTGAAIGLGSYVGSVALITTVLLVPPILGALMRNDDVSRADPADSSDNPKISHYLPLYVPLAGPIWSLAYSDVNKESGNWFWLGLLGAGQLAGTAMYFAGVAMAPKTPNNATPMSAISVLPMFDARGSRGVALVGVF